MDFRRVLATLAVTCFCVVDLVACNGRSSDAAVLYTGSTPGDDVVKSMLTIPQATKVDFIRWKLELAPLEKTFRLDINFGESQPNTLGFKAGGERKSFEGTFSEKKGDHLPVYIFTGTGLGRDLVLARITDDIAHLMIDEKLMVGNGGWSYTLNRQGGIGSTVLPTLAAPAAIMKENWMQRVFDGRTPCRELAADHPEMTVSAECFKLKWKLILNRDPVTRLPSTCVVRKIVDNQPRNIEGKWTVTKGTPTNADAIVYTLHFNKPEESISLLAANSVLFFLDTNGALLKGNSDFSYTLNAVDSQAR
jgi:hypothetical protein